MPSPPDSSRPRRRTRVSPATRRILKWHAIAAGVILFLAFLPLIGALIAGGIASANGCTLHEGFENPCVVWGTDIGGALYPWAVAPWLLMVTVPGAAILLPVIGISAAVMISRSRKKASEGRHAS